jgi:hypothetical protein
VKGLFPPGLEYGIDAHRIFDNISKKDQDVTYLAIYQGETQWTEVLSQEAYDQVAELLKGN